MSSPNPKRPVRARSGLRPAPAPRNQPPRVPGEEQSKAHDESRDARHPHDKDGNEEAAAELTQTRKRP
jgi:hypothetical protein